MQLHREKLQKQRRKELTQIEQERPSFQPVLYPRRANK